MGAKRVRRTTWLIIACAGVLLGLWLGRVYVFVPLFAALPVLCLVLRTRLALLLAAFSFGLLFGWWRGSAFLPKLDEYQTLAGQTVFLQAHATEDNVYGYSGQITFHANNVQLQDGHELTGKIQIAGYGIPMVYAGDKVQAEGKLYPARGSRQARMSYAKITILERPDSPIHSIRRQFTAGLLSVVPEPQASFGMGLLVGQRDTLPEDVADELSAVSLTHLIAVSGYNLTVIVMASRRALGGRSKYQMVLGAVLLIVLFLLVTGFSASIVRAALVSGLSLWAWYFGRTIKPLLLILFSAAATAWWYPFYIWTDIGWYLSFLAFFGVLVIAPEVQQRLFPGRDEIALLPAVAIESFCAQLMTIPIIMFIFERFSPVSLLANVLVVPFVPYAMLASLLAAIAGAVTPALAGLVAWPATLLLSYMLSVASFMSHLPFASLEWSIDIVGMFVLYGIIAMWLLTLLKRNRAKHGTITDKKFIKEEA